MDTLNLTEAVDMFIMKKFDKCFNECTAIINTAKCEPEQERNHKLIEAASALGIQALAETDLWYFVIGFVTDTYGSVDLCPPSIIQLCTLLHAQVKEYLPCHKIVEMWLKNPHNQKHKKYSQVVLTYAHHILCPSGASELLKEMSENCDALTSDEKAALLKLSQSKHLDKSSPSDKETDFSAGDDPLPGNVFSILNENTNLSYFQSNHLPKCYDKEEQHTEDHNDNSALDSRRKASKNIWDISRLHQFLKWLCSSVLSKLNYLRHPVASLFFMGILAIWALIQTQTGDPVTSLSQFIVLWRMFLNKTGLYFTNKL